MRIQLTDNYIITSDSLNFILNESHIAEDGKHKGKPVLVQVGFYPTVESLCEGLISRKLRQSTARTMKTLLQEHTELVREIRRLFRVGINGIGTMPCKECGAKAKNSSSIIS